MSHAVPVRPPAPVRATLGAAACIAAVSTAIAPGAASAQSYPAKPVRVISNSSAGGLADSAGRPVAQRLSEMFGVQFIVDARPGATGAIGNEAAAKAAPDGYTLLLTPSSFFILMPQLKPASYDPLRDFVPVAQVSRYALVLVVHPSVPARSVKELVALARAQPGRLTYVSTGVGSNFHLAAELLRIDGKFDWLHVPYKGSPAAVVDLVAGRADAMFVGYVGVQQHLKSGRLRALGVTGAERDAQLPNVPTIAESGLTGYELSSWIGFLAPAATPKEIVERLNSSINKVLETTEIRELWASQAMQPVRQTPAQFAQRVRDDYARVGRIVRTAGIKAERD